MTLPESEKKASLRETYNNAAAGADYLEMREAASRRCARAQYDYLVWSSCPAIFLAFVCVIILAIVMIVSPVFSGAIGAWALACAITCVLVYIAASRYAERRFSLKVHRAEYEQLRSLPAGVDGVQRTWRENEFLKGRFGVSMGLFMHVEHVLGTLSYGHARHGYVLMPTGRIDEALAALGQARADLQAEMALLETIWKSSTDTNVCADLINFMPERRVEEILAKVAPHIPVLVVYCKVPTP